MIKAKPHQQQPPNPSQCGVCGERFNNKRRRNDHIGDMAFAGDARHEEFAKSRAQSRGIRL